MGMIPASLLGTHCIDAVTAQRANTPGPLQPAAVFAPRVCTWYIQLWSVCPVQWLHYVEHDAAMSEPTLYRCVSWVAVSTVVQAERESPVDQKRKNLEFIESLGRHYPNSRGVLVRTFTMAASRSITLLSDACTLHEQYAQLVEMIRSRSFDLLICRSRDRLGRTLPLVTAIEKLCLDHGIVVVPRMSLPSTINYRELVKAEGSGLIGAIEAQMAESEVRRLVNRHEMGMRGRVLNSKLFANHVPYGYRYQYDRDGQRKIVIDDSAAAVVRLILVDLYWRAGWGVPKIARYLNDQRITSPRASIWYSGTLRQLIERVYRYTGYLELNHRSLTGRDETRIKGDHPPILSEEELAGILAVRDERHHTRTSEVTRRVFSGIAYCTICGHPLHVHWLTYRRKRTGEVVRTPTMRCAPDSYTSHLSISEAHLMEAARAAIAKLEELADMSEYVDQDIESRMDILRTRLAGLQKQRESIAKQRARLVDVYVEKGLIPTNEFQTRLAGLDQKIVETEEQEAAFVEKLEIEDRASNRAERLEELRRAGTRLLDLAETEPVLVRNWLHGVMRIWVAKGGIVERIEFI